MPTDGTAPGAPEPARRGWKSRFPAPLRHGATIFILLLVLEYYVIPRLAIAGKNLGVLEHLNIVWLLAGLALEVAALVGYAKLSQALLPRNAPSLFTIFRIDLVGNAVAHVLPGGTAGSAGFGYRLLTERGVSGADAGFSIATQGMGSAVVLNVLLWISLVVSIPFAGLHSWYESVALLVGMLALLALGALVFALTRGEEVAARALRALARPIPRVTEAQADRFVRRVGMSLRDLGRDRERLRRAVLWAALNWLLDAASLWAFVAAFGYYVNPFELFVAYGVANVLAVIPITPGGIGIVEVVAAGLLTSFGVHGVALLAVIGWRIVNFWLPIPCGAAAYVSLRVERGAGLRAQQRALFQMAEEAAKGGPPGGSPLAYQPGAPDEPSHAEDSPEGDSHEGDSHDASSPEGR